jgi:hypothetical protein
MSRYIKLLRSYSEDLSLSWVELALEIFSIRVIIVLFSHFPHSLRELRWRKNLNLSFFIGFFLFLLKQEMLLCLELAHLLLDLLNLEVQVNNRVYIKDTLKINLLFLLLFHFLELLLRILHDQMLQVKLMLLLDFQNRFLGLFVFLLYNVNDPWLERLLSEQALV